MKSRHSDEMLERTSLYALGTLAGAELEELEIHLSEGCAICAEALRRFVLVRDHLGHAAGEAEARPQLRAAMLARIAAEAALDTRTTLDAEGVFFARTPALDWRPSPLPGFAAKVLFRDPQRRRRSQLVRLAAGAAIPAHLHTDAEEIFVLEGDLIVNDIAMRAGDYCRAETDSTHRTTHSPNGCVFLVISSENDRPLPPE